MRRSTPAIAILLTLATSLWWVAAHGAQSDPATERGAVQAIPLEKLIDSVARKTHKKFIVDPRVKADVTLVGEDAERIDYAALLSVLQVHGFTAVESGAFVQVIPEASVRQLPLPLVTGNQSFADAQYVSKVITVRNVSAPSLVPLLRPLLPQSAHLAALSCTNRLIIVDSFANVRRIEALVGALDVGEPFKPGACQE